MWKWKADFNVESEAKEFIMTRGQFGLFYGGAKTNNKVYRCTNVKSRGDVQCDEKYRILIPSDDSSVFKVQWNKKHHSCEQNNQRRKNVLNQASIDYLSLLYNAGIRGPKKMITCLIREKKEGNISFDEIPKLHQIRYFLSKIRDTSVDASELSLAER